MGCGCKDETTRCLSLEAFTLIGEQDSLFLSRKEDCKRQGSATGEKVIKSEQQGRGVSLPCVLRSEQELCCKQARRSIPRKEAIQNGLSLCEFLEHICISWHQTTLHLFVYHLEIISCLTNILISSKQKLSLLKEKDPVFCCICIPYMALVMSSTK